MAETKFFMNPKNKINAVPLVNWQQARVLELQAAYNDAFDTGAGTYDEMRAAYRKERSQWNSGGPEMAESTDVDIPFGTGTVHTRILRPSEEKKRPVIFFIHGGGYVVGDLDTHSLTQRKLAAYSGCTVIGIDYTLSPESRYPQAVEESAAVVRYYTEHAAEYALEMEKIGFAGDSGGGNLSMAVTVYLRDNGYDMTRIKANILYYGMYGLPKSYSEHLHGGSWDGLTEADFAYYEKMYLGDQKAADCQYYNIYSNDLTYDIPPAFIAAGSLDPLRDDSFLLYTVLKENGIDCEYMEYEGALHAFIHYSKIMDDAEDALRRGAHFFAHACGMDPRN